MSLNYSVTPSPSNLYVSICGVCEPVDICSIVTAVTPEACPRIILHSHGVEGTETRTEGFPCDFYSDFWLCFFGLKLHIHTDRRYKKRWIWKVLIKSGAGLFVSEHTIISGAQTQMNTIKFLSSLRYFLRKQKQILARISWKYQTLCSCYWTCS